MRDIPHDYELPERLPGDWSAQKLGGIGSFVRGSGGPKRDEVSDGFPCVRYGDLYTFHDCCIRDTRSRISAGRTKSYTKLQYGDLLFAGSGETLDEIGKSAVNLMREPAYCGGDVIILRPEIEIIPSYLGYVADCTSSRIQKSRMGSGSTVMHIYSGQLSDLTVWVPPLEEQRRIADILDTLDETIQFTERVIAKHEAIRSGLTSDLLKGRFSRTGSGEWKEVTLGRIGTVVGGGTPSRDRYACWDGDVPWLTPGEITQKRRKYVSETREYISEFGLSSSGATLVPTGSVLITSRASIGSCALAGRPLATNQGFKILIPNALVDSSYLYFLSLTLSREMERRASGTTFLEISSREFERIEVRLPPLEEQRRIAEILDEVDEAIQANEEQLKKLQRLRSGLADDLLSGRVRTA